MFKCLIFKLVEEGREKGIYPVNSVDLGADYSHYRKSPCTLLLE